MTLTPSDLLPRHAPRDEVSPDPGLDAVLARVLDGARLRRQVDEQRRVVRRRVLLGAGVAAVTVTAVLLPAALRSDDAEVQALRHLADTAGSRPASVIAPGKFLHLVMVENPDGRSNFITGEDPDFYPRRLESWTAADGTVWRHDTEAGGRESWYRFAPTHEADGRPDFSPKTLAALPTTGEALLNHLRQALGGSPTDEEVFIHLEHALRAGYAPPQVQRALIGAMARLPHITAERTRAQDDRPCLQVTFAGPNRGGRSQYVCFDERTATLIESGEFLDGAPFFTSLVTGREMVDIVPPEVLTRGADTFQG